MIMKFWIARDEIGNIILFINEPYQCRIAGTIYWTCNRPAGNYMYLPQESFPEVTFENSPQEVELKLVDK